LLLPDYRDAGATDWLLHAAWLLAIALFVLHSFDVRLVPQRVARIVDARRRPTGALVDA
jgi:hypothetical protein